jgi:2',3'-cyclic-nucleotide 3'-phosphodiesterase
MPGASLWLLPPENSAVRETLQSLITTEIPGLLNNPSAPTFVPHVTLTSDIDILLLTKEFVDPEKWLSTLSWEFDGVCHVQFKELAVGDKFTKKLFVRCIKEEKGDDLASFAGYCREKALIQEKAGAAEGAKEAYDPHVSLM